MGYSNNAEYFGDWFGEGQIDYSKILFNDSKGDVYFIKLWCGSGYVCDVYLVRAISVIDAIDKVLDWSYQNEGQNKIVKDRQYLEKLCYEDFDNEYYYGIDGGKPSDKMSYEEFETEWFETFIGNSDCTLYAYEENFLVRKIDESNL